MNVCLKFFNPEEKCNVCVWKTSKTRLKHSKLSVAYFSRALINQKHKKLQNFIIERSSFSFYIVSAYTYIKRIICAPNPKFQSWCCVAPGSEHSAQMLSNYPHNLHIWLIALGLISPKWKHCFIVPHNFLPFFKLVFPCSKLRRSVSDIVIKCDVFTKFCASFVYCESLAESTQRPVRWSDEC